MDGAADSYDITESAELRIVVGSLVVIRDDCTFCGTALDVRDMLRARDCCMSGVGVERPLLGDDGSALSRLCNDIRFWVARGVTELVRKGIWISFLVKSIWGAGAEVSSSESQLSCRSGSTGLVTGERGALLVIELDASCMVAKSRTSGSLNAPPLPLTLGLASVSGAMTLSTYAGANSVELPILAELIVMFDFRRTQ